MITSLAGKVNPKSNFSQKTAGGGADDVSAAKADTGSGAGALEAEAWEQWAKPVVDALEGWLDEGMEPGRIRSRLQETAPDTDALAAAFSAVPGSGLGADAAVRKGEKVAAAHCNQYGHKPGCSRGEGALADDKPPRQIRSADWGNNIGKGKVIRTPLNEKVVLTKDIENDWAGKKDNEIFWRKVNLLYALETLRNPQEIWQGYRGNKVHVSRFGADKSGRQPARVVIAVTHGSKVITYYAEKKAMEGMEKYRRGKLLYKRKKAGE